MVSFPSSLVGFLGFHPYMRLFSFRKLFCDLYSLIPRLTRYFVALKLYIYSLLPRLPPFFCSSICVQYNTSSRRDMKNRKGLGYVHLTSTRHHSCEKCSQASPVFCCSSTSMYYTECKLKNKKGWRLGNEASTYTVVRLLLSPLQWNPTIPNL